MKIIHKKWINYFRPFFYLSFILVCSIVSAQETVPPKDEKKPSLDVMETGGVADPQLMSNHPFFKGELAYSTFERLFASQAELYTRVTGRKVDNNEDKAIASWFWRNTHYFHCAVIPEPDILGVGKHEVTCDYWAGLFSYGHGMCQESHYQYTAEMEKLLGHCYGRAVGLGGHTSFEVCLKGGAYDKGRWVLLDQDISTVCFDKEQKALIGIDEIMKTPKGELLTNRKAKENRGWLPELYEGDGDLYYGGPKFWAPLSGYVCAPPSVHLRTGETLKRYPRPGFGASDEKTVAFWGLSPDGMIGPNRHISFVSKPDKFFNASARLKHENDPKKRARYGNAVFVYTPNFKDSSYKEGVVAEDDTSVTFMHASPYIIAVKPASVKCYDAGSTLGLVLNGSATCKVCISLDGQKTFSEPIDFKDGLDYSDLVKGRYQYWIKFLAPAKDLSDKNITITTRCMANGYVMPHLKSEETQITFNTSDFAVLNVGPQKEDFIKSIIEGGLDKPSFVSKLNSPHGEKIKTIYWAVRAGTGTPPRPELEFKAEYSADGKEWKILNDKWRVNPPEPYDPPDTWSQSFFYGSSDISADGLKEVQIRISNNKGRTYIMGQFALSYQIKPTASTKVVYCWEDEGKEAKEEHIYPIGAKMDESWKIKTGKDPILKWIEMTPVK